MIELFTYVLFLSDLVGSQIQAPKKKLQPRIISTLPTCKLQDCATLALCGAQRSTREFVVRASVPRCVLADAVHYLGIAPGAGLGCTAKAGTPSQWPQYIWKAEAKEAPRHEQIYRHPGTQKKRVFYNKAYRQFYPSTLSTAKSRYKGSICTKEENAVR